MSEQDPMPQGCLRLVGRPNKTGAMHVAIIRVRDQIGPLVSVP